MARRRRKSARRSHSRRRRHLASAPMPSSLYGLGQMELGEYHEGHHLGELSMGAKVGIGVGVVAVLGIGGYFLWKSMSDAS